MTLTRPQAREAVQACLAEAGYPDATVTVRRGKVHASGAPWPVVWRAGAIVSQAAGKRMPCWPCWEASGYTSAPDCTHDLWEGAPIGAVGA